MSSSLTVAAVAAAATVAAAAAAAASAGASTRMSIVAQQEQQHHAPSFIAPSCTLPSSGRAPNLRAPNSGHRLSTSAFGRRPRPIDGDGVSLPSWDRRRGGSGAAGVLDRRHPRHLALNSVRKEGEEGATAAAAAGTEGSTFSSSLSEAEGGGGGGGCEGIGDERQQEEEEKKEEKDGEVEGEEEDERDKELNDIDHRCVCFRVHTSTIVSPRTKHFMCRPTQHNDSSYTSIYLEQAAVVRTVATWLVTSRGGNRQRCSLTVYWHTRYTVPGITGDHS